MAKKLHYFNINGLCEPIRYIMYYSGQKFEDIRYSHDEWPVKSVKDILPYGQLPFYEDGDRKLNQSLAIARYVGSQNDLVPSDAWEQAVLDAAVFNIFDFWKQVQQAVFRETDPEKKQIAKKKVLEETIPYFFSRFEKELKAKNGYFGGKLSWADFVLVGIIECGELFLGDQFSKNYPTVAALVDKVRNLPGVKEYIAKRTPYAVPSHAR